MRFFPEEDPAMLTAWRMSLSLGIVMANSINTFYDLFGLQISSNIEFFKPSANFFRLGVNLDVGFFGIDADAFKNTNPNVDNVPSDVAHFIKGGTFTRMYPSDVFYLSGGANFGYYGAIEGKSNTGKVVAKSPATHTFIFPVGLGFIFGSNDRFFEAYYNIAVLKNGTGGYWSINTGWSGKKVY